MNHSDGQPRETTFPWWMFVLWLAAFLAAAVALGWVAHAAPVKVHLLLVFPVVLGVLLGLAGGALAGGRPIGFFWAVAASLLAAAGLAVSQHYFVYRDYAAAYDEGLQRAGQRHPLAALAARQALPPANFAEFMQKQAERGRTLWPGVLVARGWAAWASWCADALLIAVAASVVLLRMGRKPPPTAPD